MSESGFELSVERYIDAPPARVYDVWTTRLAEWWCPLPWTTTIIAMDLRAGGRFATLMTGPGGESSPVEGVVLEIVPNERIVFSDAFTVGWIPHTPFMTGIFEFAPDGQGTRYRAASRHWSEAAMRQHQDMGFHQGWTAVAAQLAALAEQPARGS